MTMCRICRLRTLQLHISLGTWLAEGELALVASGSGLLINPEEVELAKKGLAVVASGAGLLVDP